MRSVLDLVCGRKYSVWCAHAKRCGSSWYAGFSKTGVRACLLRWMDRESAHAGLWLMKPYVVEDDYDSAVKRGFLIVGMRASRTHGRGDAQQGVLADRGGGRN